jgi:long-chain fatty acid transport protein
MGNVSPIRYTLVAAIFIGLLFTGGPAWAGGFYLNEYGTPSSGTAQAGAEAVARDASTVWHNPAGMTRVEGQDLMLGAAVMFANAEFDPAPTTPVPGGDGGSLDTLIPLGGAWYSHKVNDRLSLGLSFGGITGADAEYDPGWTGRYQVQSIEMLMVGLQPSVAYRVNDWLSIGAGPVIAYGELELKIGIPSPPAPVESQAKVDGDDWVFGFNAGVLIEPSERFRLGVVYRSEIEPEFSGDLDISPLPIPTLASDLEFPLAQTVRAGAYFELNDKVALLCSVAWEDWSAMDNVFLNTAVISAKLPRNWDDTWHVSGGVHFRPKEDWLLQTGFSYDSSPVDDDDRTADMPIDRQWKIAAGAQKDLSERLTLGGQFVYMNMGDAEIQNPSPVNGLIGEYDPNEIYVFAVNANWRF